MKYVFRLIFRALCLLLLVAFLVSCFTQFIPPSKFSFITFFGVAFPYLFLLILVLALVCLFINRKIAAILLVSLLLGYNNVRSSFAFHLNSKSILKHDDSACRIMTWNVEDFVNLLPGNPVRLKMLHVIQKNNPDVLCVQEFSEVEGSKWRISVSHELDSLGYKYHFFSNDNISRNASDRVVARGVAIFAKKPFADSGRINIRKKVLNENAIYVTLNYNNKPLRIYTAHLASFALYGDTVNSGSNDIYKLTYHRKRTIEYKLRETEQLHEQQVKIIRSELDKSPLPLIYCGDMNATPCSYNYRYLKNKMQDAFLEKGAGIGGTFYKILPTLRIDYCFADSSFKIDQCYVLKRKLSDHYPVITDLSWK